MVRLGYSVEAYEFKESIWSAGDPNGLISAIDQVCSSLQSKISGLSTNTTVGIFGSSLGAFIGYNCMARIPEVDWCVMNTGGDVAQAVWRMPHIREYFKKTNYNEETLRSAWSRLQYPDLANYKNKRVLLISSHSDEIVPFDGAIRTFNAIIEARPKHKVILHKRLNHKRTVIRNLARTRKLVKLVETL